MDLRLQWFEKLYDTYADAIFRHLAYRLNDRERAKELTQEVFMKTWQYVMLGKEIEHDKAFLYRIAHNLFVNEIRTDKRNIPLSDIEESGYEVPDQAAPGSGIQAEKNELLDHLWRLKNEYREVLIMRYIDGLAVKEIAALLEENETNISMRIKRAIEALQTNYHQPHPKKL